MRKLLILLCLAMVGLAGCGDDGGGDVDVASNEDGSDSDFTGKDGKDFCEYYKKQDQVLQELRLTKETPPAERKKGAATVLEAYEGLEDRAPAEIKADVAVTLSQAKPTLEAWAKGEEYEPKPEDEPTEAKSKEAIAAAGRLRTYATDVCGVKDDTPSSSQQAPAGSQPPADE